MYLQKSGDEILRQALAKLSDRTSITATTPGSVARSIAELVADDLGNFFAVLNFNMQQSVLSTASGRALDLWGALYNLPRKNLSDLTAQAALIGAFYFYSDSPVPQSILIPRGTRVSTTLSDGIGEQYSYATTTDVTIPAGRLRAYAPITNLFSDSVFTAGINTLVVHSYTPPNGIVIKCTNPKTIASQVGIEDDDDYRTRLIAETRRQAGGTEQAIRFTALGMTGVRDVIVRPAVYGLGSVEVVVNTENYEMSNAVLPRVAAALEYVRPVGIRLFVREPTLLRLNVDAVLNIKRINSTSEDQVTYRAKNAILRYINTLTINEELVYNRLVSEILNSSEEVIDVSFTGLGVNGSEILRKNFGPKDDEHLIPGSINVRIS